MSELGDRSTQVSIGPDLNSSRTPLDKKLYRQILLPNGLRAVLICDTVAMHQRQTSGRATDCYSDSEEEDQETSDGSDEESGDAGEEEDGLREAAAAMVVGVGSLYDPPFAQGLAHFLEHMLFMGTRKYPEENAYDKFLSKNGGTDNAWTESEHTTFYLEISQDFLFPALDMFAQFFIEPLLLEDAVDRELNAVESEFQLTKNSDSTRAEQLMCHTNGKTIEEHPFGKFSWGNLKSLVDVPNEQKKDLMKELWTFYHQYYYAQNMRLVVVGGYSLDALQEKVVSYFSDIPDLPRESSPLQATHANSNTWEETYESKISSFGLPLSTSSLKTIFRVVPIQDRHTLTITWQLPSQFRNWRSKPCDLIGHLIGHEAQGSILSSLRHKSWAFGCVAGTGDDGLVNASSHALFSMSFTLAEEGVKHWPEVVTEVYRYIGMLRFYCASSDGLPEWIYEELRNIQDVSYRYSDEPASDDLVQTIAEELAPHWAVPPERLLDGNNLLFDYEPETCKSLLDDFLSPQNARIDLMSSAFGRACDFDADENAVESKEAEEAAEVCTSTEFDVISAGGPEIEPMFGTRFWRRALPEKLIASWSKAFAPAVPTPESRLSLPPKNPFVPESYALKSLPPEDDDHPLIHSSLKICINVGKKKSWFPATVTKYDGVNNQLLLTYEDEDEKWHTVDHTVGHFAATTLSPGYEGTFDQKSIKYRIISLPSHGKGPELKYGDESDHLVDDGAQFPLIPPRLSESRLPQLISDTQILKLWHLQDRIFKRPIAELRLNLVCGDANKTPLHRACSDLLVQLCYDAVTETSYLASVCELGSSLESGDMGFTIRVHGFEDKLLELFRLIFAVLLSFRGQSTMPDTIKPGRFAACLELQRRKYANYGMKASKLCSSGRYRCLLVASRSPGAKSAALENIDESTFCSTVSEVLLRIGIEALYHGNVNRSDAEIARDTILDMIRGSGDAGLPRKEHPAEFVTKLPLDRARKDIVLPSRDSTEPNSAVEVYFQMGKDSLKERVTLDLLAHMMDEPLYNQVRTKDQFGYEVSCDSRWTCGVMGMYFRIVSSVKSTAESVDRVDRFITDYYKTLKDMSPEGFVEEVIGLATTKLEMHESLADACDSFWAEIRDRRYTWQPEREEALALRNLTKEEVLAAYEQWLMPLTKEGAPNKRRTLTVQVIGTGDGSVSDGRPKVEDAKVGDYIDECIDAFHKSVGHQTWGRIY